MQWVQHVNNKLILYKYTTLSVRESVCAWQMNWSLQASGSVNSSCSLQAWSENVIGRYQIIAFPTPTFPCILNLLKGMWGECG